MIIANITTYVGQCADAEHYYCNYDVSEEIKPTIDYRGDEELRRIITKQSEVDRINKKDRHSGFWVGRDTNRYNTIEEIHQQLIKEFGDQTIITYYENKIFKDMLYYVNGVNLTYKEFGDIYLNMPTQCYKDLLPDISTIKIKCADCGHTYTYDELYKREYKSESGRILVQFKRKYDMTACCRWFDLEWNVVL